MKKIILGLVFSIVSMSGVYAAVQDNPTAQVVVDYRAVLTNVKKELAANQSPLAKKYKDIAAELELSERVVPPHKAKMIEWLAEMNELLSDDSLNRTEKLRAVAKLHARQPQQLSETSWHTWAKRIGGVALVALIATALVKWLRGRQMPARPAPVPKSVSLAAIRREYGLPRNKGFYVAQKVFYTAAQVNALAKKGDVRVLFGENTANRLRRTVAERGYFGGQAGVFSELTQAGIGCMMPVTTTDYSSPEWRASKKNVGNDAVVREAFRDDLAAIEAEMQSGKVILVPVDKDGNCTIGQGLANISDDMKAEVRAGIADLLGEGMVYWLDHDSMALHSVPASGG